MSVVGGKQTLDISSRMTFEVRQKIVWYSGAPRLFKPRGAPRLPRAFSVTLYRYYAQFQAGQFVGLGVTSMRNFGGVGTKTEDGAMDTATNLAVTVALRFLTLWGL